MQYEPPLYSKRASALYSTASLKLLIFNILLKIYLYIDRIYCNLYIVVYKINVQL